MPRVGRRQFIQLGASGLLIPDYFNLRAHSKPSQNSSFAAGFRQASLYRSFCLGRLEPLGQPRPKPDAESESRNFSSHQNHCPGIRVSEISQFARTMQNGRSCAAFLTMPSHRSGAYWNLTGHEPPNPGGWPFPGQAGLPSVPWFGSPRRWTRSIPGTVALPYTLTTVARPTDRTRLSWIERDPAVVYPNSEGFRLYDVKSPSSGRIDLSLPQGLEAYQTADFSEKSTGIQPGKAKPRRTENAQALAQQKTLTCCRRRHKTPSIWKGNPGHEGIYGMRLWTKRPHGPKADRPEFRSHGLFVAGDLNGSKGAHFDTHADNFNRQKSNAPPRSSCQLARTDLSKEDSWMKPSWSLDRIWSNTPDRRQRRRRSPTRCYSVAFAGVA